MIEFIAVSAAVIALLFAVKAWVFMLVGPGPSGPFRNNPPQMPEGDSEGPVGDAHGPTGPWEFPDTGPTDYPPGHPEPNQDK